MTKSILLQTIKTPDGDTDAYALISHLLEQKSEDLGDACPPDGEMYAEALARLNQVMKGVELETTDYTQEQIETILLFLENDFAWYEKEQLNPIISSYLKNRIALFKEEED